MEPKSESENLVRVLGRRDLTALAINQIIRASIFVIGAPLAMNVGGFSLAVILAIGLVNFIIAMCVAEVASRFDSTGGPYLYARQALGVSAGFTVGWMQWFLRVVSIAAILHILLSSLAVWMPWLKSSPLEQLFFVFAIGGIGLVLFSGIRQSSAFVNLLTVSKLLPLFAFVVIGLPHISLDRVVSSFDVSVDMSQWIAAALLVIFSLGGFEVASVPGGESKDGRKHMVFALAMALFVATGLLFLVQFILLGVLADLPQSETPVADAMTQFLGQPGGLLVAIGLTISIFGATCGGFLAASRILFSMAHFRDLPGILSTVHPRTKTPWLAIVVTGIAALWLSLTGDFVTLAAASGIARIVMYLGACGAALRYRFDQKDKPAEFTLPGGILVHLIAIGAAGALLFSISVDEMISAAIILAIGIALTALTRAYETFRKSGRFGEQT